MHVRRHRRHHLVCRLQQNNDGLPTTLDAGVTSIPQSGSHTITVEIQLVLEGDTTATTSSSSNNSSAIHSTSTNSREYQSFAPGASFAPLAVVVGLAAMTNMVRDGRKCVWDYAASFCMYRGSHCFHANSIHSIQPSLHHDILQVELSLALGIFTGSCSEC